MKSLNIKPVSASLSHKEDGSNREITVNDLSSSALIKLARFCRLCCENLQYEIKLTSPNVLRQVYVLGLNTNNRTIKLLFLSFHKDIENSLNQLNSQLDLNDIYYTLPQLNDADFDRSKNSRV